MTQGRNTAVHGRGTSLRTRFLLIGLLIFACGATATYLVVNRFSEAVARTLVSRFAEQSVLYEKSRVLQLLLREITLTQKMASSPLLKAWVRNEDDPALRQRAIAELEDYRTFYRSRSYFFAIAGSGNYYFNDDEGRHDVRRPRYKLHSKNPTDAWFYETVRQVKDYQLNVNTDRVLRITRVWINSVVKDDGEALAVTGTGVDLTDFIQSVVSSTQAGITNILLDRNGAIQAHHDVSIIDFGSIAKRREQQSTVFQLIDNEEARSAFRSALDTVSASPDITRSMVLSIQGKNHVAGIAYVPEIKWFLVTLTYPDHGQGARYGGGVAAVLVAALGLTLLIAGFVFDRMVLRRVTALDNAARRIAEGDYGSLPLPAGNDEISRLGRTLANMAQRIETHTAELETQIAERTAALERLANADFMTGLLNRRGMIERIEMERNRLIRQGGQLGVILIDIDGFKNINDRHGHGVGDQAIVHCANTLRELMRSYDLCARWGGEEFLVVVPGIADGKDLAGTAQKLRAAVEQHPLQAPGGTVSLTISAGCCIAPASISVDAMLKSADDALYRAKQQGRNRVIMAESPAGQSAARPQS